VSYGSENAHNNFLQIGAELGLVGFGTFSVWIGAAVARSVRALLRAPATRGSSAPRRRDCLPRHYG
jgi:O-antigen ligase